MPTSARWKLRTAPRPGDLFHGDGVFFRGLLLGNDFVQSLAVFVFVVDQFFQRDFSLLLAIHALGVDGFNIAFVRFAEHFGPLLLEQFGVARLEACLQRVEFFPCARRQPKRWA